MDFKETQGRTNLDAVCELIRIYQLAHHKDELEFYVGNLIGTTILARSLARRRIVCPTKPDHTVNTEGLVVGRVRTKVTLE